MRVLPEFRRTVLSVGRGSSCRTVRILGQEKEELQLLISLLAGFRLPDGMQADRNI